MRENSHKYIPISMIQSRFAGLDCLVALNPRTSVLEVSIYKHGLIKVAEFVAPILLRLRRRGDPVVQEAMIREDTINQVIVDIRSVVSSIPEEDV